MPDTTKGNPAPALTPGEATSASTRPYGSSSQIAVYCYAPAAPTLAQWGRAMRLATDFNAPVVHINSAAPYFLPDGYIHVTLENDEGGFAFEAGIDAEGAASS